MAFSSPDPASAYSLWLQLRTTKRKRRHRWRSDWMPLLVVLLLFSLLLIVYVTMPPNDAPEQTNQASQQETGLQGRSMTTLVTP